MKDPAANTMSCNLQEVGLSFSSIASKVNPTTWSGCIPPILRKRPGHSIKNSSIRYPLHLSTSVLMALGTMVWTYLLAERNTRISNTPNVVASATADVAMFLLLGALRHAIIPVQAIRDGQWKGGTPLGHDPDGKILGILGMEAIGQERRMVSSMSVFD